MSCKECLHHNRNKKACVECNMLSNVMEPNPKFVKNSNYNRIRNMTVEEMAETLKNIDVVCFENCKKETGNMFKCPYGEDVDTDAQCKQCYIKWLESEVV